MVSKFDQLNQGDPVEVINGPHKGKSGVVNVVDLNGWRAWVQFDPGPNGLSYIFWLDLNDVKPKNRSGGNTFVWPAK